MRSITPAEQRDLEVAADSGAVFETRVAAAKRAIRSLGRAALKREPA